MKPCLLAFLLLLALTGYSQTFINRSVVTIRPGTILTIKGNWINGQGGVFAVNGALHVSGDLENHDPAYGFRNATGKVVLNGRVQVIGGSRPVHFPMLELTGGVKTLEQSVMVGFGEREAGYRLLLQSAILKLNTHTLTLHASSPAAIQRTTGFIESESNSSEGLGRVVWNVGRAAPQTAYVFPFGNSRTQSYLPLTVILPQSAPARAYLSAATYAASATGNRPLPAGVLHFKDASGRELAPRALDRFWIVGGQDMPAGATVHLSAVYRDAEWNGGQGAPNTISEKNLTPMYWDGGGWATAAGGANASANSLSVSGLLLAKGIVTAHDSGAAASGSEAALLSESGLKVMAYPNPSRQAFTLSVRHSREEVWSVRIFDALGRLLETRKDISAAATFTFGAAYRPGVYYASVSAGGEPKIVKLVKTGD